MDLNALRQGRLHPQNRRRHNHRHIQASAAPAPGGSPLPTKANHLLQNVQPHASHTREKEQVVHLRGGVQPQALWQVLLGIGLHTDP